MDVYYQIIYLCSKCACIDIVTRVHGHEVKLEASAKGVYEMLNELANWRLRIAEMSIFVTLYKVNRGAT